MSKIKNLDYIITGSVVGFLLCVTIAVIIIKRNNIMNTKKEDKTFHQRYNDGEFYNTNTQIYNVLQESSNDTYVIDSRYSSHNDSVENQKFIIRSNTHLRTVIRNYFELNDGDENKIDISNLDTTNVTNMNLLFNDRKDFNEDISGWDVSNVTSMVGMFKNATQFNQDISSWDVSNVRNMYQMFYFAQDFNKPIFQITSNVNLSGMFHYATKFNQDISRWDVSKVTDMKYMFSYATNFNQDISGWDVSKVIDMTGMFSYATNFNQNIDDWPVNNLLYICNNEYEDIDTIIITKETSVIINEISTFIFFNATNFIENKNVYSWLGKMPYPGKKNFEKFNSYLKKNDKLLQQHGDLLFLFQKNVKSSRKGVRRVR